MIWGNLMSSMKLNDQQKTAVEYAKGPLLIIAGAGTGKTRVIAERIKYLITKKNVLPDEICALTFTEKAAMEMQDRVDAYLPLGYSNISISTFHSFCDRVLREDALNIGLASDFNLINEAESVKLFKDHLFDFGLKYYRPLGNPKKFITEILKHFSRLQDEYIMPDDYSKWVAHEEKNNGLSPEDKEELLKYKELSKAYVLYQKIKQEKGLMDYGDLISNTITLFKQRKNILKKYQKRFKYVLVDEYQDVNYAQNLLAIALSGKDEKANITVCGDDDQGIYRFRGASVSNILEFKKIYKKAKIVVLTKNYRSGKNILDAAYRLIKNNNPDRLEYIQKIDKHLVSANNKKGEIKFLHTRHLEDETQKVSEEISALVKEKGYQYSDIAVLVRANNHAEPFVRTFERLGIPNQFLGPEKLFKKKEILDLISYLKVLDDLGDSTSLFRLLSIEYFEIDDTDLQKLNSYSKKYNLTLFEACEEVLQDEENLTISKDTREKLNTLFENLKGEIKKVKTHTAGSLLYNHLQANNLMKKIFSPESENVQVKAANITKFFNKLKNFEIKNDDASVRAVCDWIDISSESVEASVIESDWSEENSVKILTVHGAKGLEFPVVFMVNLVSLRFPSLDIKDQIPIPLDLIRERLPSGDYHMQEERRLFYVGTTRAMDKLYYCASDFYSDSGRKKQVSPFVIEALTDTKVLSTDLEDVKEGIMGYQEVVSKDKPESNYKLKVKIDYLSYSQINTFQICPMHYKLNYIYKVPTPPSAYLSFGVSLHAVMKDFYELAKSGKKVGKIDMEQLLDKEWTPQGYISKKHERQMYEQGKKYLNLYIEQEFDSDRLPLFLEKKFTLPLPKRKNEFPLKIGGTIDRLDVYEDGNVEIIDYKTGERVPSQKEVDKNKQLTFYALMLSMAGDLPFVFDLDKLTLSLYYFDEQKKISTTRTQKELENTIDEIYQVRKEIENSDLSCSGNYLCRSCEFSQFCKFGE